MTGALTALAVTGALVVAQPWAGDSSSDKVALSGAVPAGLGAVEARGDDAAARGMTRDRWTSSSTSSSTTSSTTMRKRTPVGSWTRTRTKTATSTSTTSSTSTSASTPTTTTTTTGGSTLAGWPSATNTGAKGTLTKKSGLITVTANKTVIENLDLTGGIIVKPGVTGTVIRNVKITATGYWGIDMDGTGGLVEDSTVIGNSSTNSSIGDFGNGNTFRRVNLSAADDGIKMGSGGTLIDSYVHDLDLDAESHNDAVQFQDYDGISVIHNWLLSPKGGTSAILMGGGESRPGARNIVVDRNFMAGGAFAFYGPSGGSSISSNVKVTNNLFSTMVYAKGGYFGAATQWETGTGNLWSNNTWADGTKKGQPVTP